MAKIYIEIEGTDCSGKETQSKLLKEAINSRTQKVEIISFPRYKNSSSFYVKKYLSGEMGDINSLSPCEIARYYAEDRRISYHNEWEEIANKNDVIIFDRYVDSNLIYQYPKFNTMKDKKDFTKWLYDLEFNNNELPKPTIKFLLNTPFDVAKKYNEKRLNKINNLKKKDLHEANENYMMQISQSCLDYYKIVPNVHMILTTKDNDFKPHKEITQEIINILKTL